MNARQWALLCGLASLLLTLIGCAALTGGAKKDAVEATRERDAAAASRDGTPEAVADPQFAVPPLEVTSKEFDASPAKSDEVADFFGEAAVLALIAAAAAGFIHLYQHRLPLLAFLVSMAALTVAGLAFLNSAT